MLVCWVTDDAEVLAVQINSTATSRDQGNYISVFYLYVEVKSCDCYFARQHYYWSFFLKYL
jgi:hypothetical protein